MRVRTAVAVVCSFVAIKVAVTWMALNAWASFPEQGIAHHWHIELGPLAEWLAAAAAAGAAIVALTIAARDRKDRIGEHHDRQKTHARLVQLSVEADSKGTVNVQARNFGPLPVIDIDLVDAAWSEHHDARWEPLGSYWAGRNRRATSTHRPILKPAQGLEDTLDTLADFVIRFVNRDGELLATVEPRTSNYPIPSYVPIDVSKVVVKVRFTTADGVRWETPSKGHGAGEPTRL